jgi:creatinine amidohydrolase
MKKTLLSHMTWKEVEEAAQSNTLVLIPIGTQENQGPHNLLGLETFTTSTVSQRVAERCGALVAPVLPFGASGAFKNFPGTIALRPEVLRDVYEDILTSLARHGFDHLLFINHHGPNGWSIEEACRKLRETHGLVSGQIEIRMLFRELTRDLFKGKESAIGHGGDPGTSLMLHLFPEDVRMDLAEKESLLPYQGIDAESDSIFKFQGGRVNLYLNMEEVAPSGRWGDPTVGDPEVGRIAMDRVVDYVASFAEKFKEMDTRVAK